ncbi:replication protein A 70 kDa DNA-binding subunit C-like isoform X4 [Phragmites australis]|nr:replication protein A 70 kDa DNA-binding subunit C-like isoform X4 [Phragmites australis]XP_062182704.1 replication protein A 70 kDa DNA-binding subunit C-like isoform X4 [Phragmites australis]
MVWLVICVRLFFFCFASALEIGACHLVPLFVRRSVVFVVVRGLFRYRVSAYTASARLVASGPWTINKMSAVSMLRDMHPRSRHWVVCTRVSRMWEYRGGTDDGDVRHIDLVLLDAEGTAMYAEIGSDNIKHKKSLLSEGNVYTLQRFRVLNSKRSYKPVSSEFMIEITCHTLIEETSEYQPTIPLYTYNLTKFPDLPALIGETKHFVDVIGLITEVADATSVQLSNHTRPTSRRAITLRDTSSYQIKLYLWGQRASEFDANEVYAIGERDPVIAIFVGTLMKSYKG